MELKGSKTEKNVEASLKGESVARNKYTFYAMRAREEGDQDIAELFEEMAKNETMHAKIWFKYLNQGLGSTLGNLQNAAMGEYSEWSSMYPEFARQAREEGFDEIADMFERVAGIEKSHEKRFLTAYASYVAQKAGTAKKGADKAEEAASKQESTVKVPGYRCMFCGAEFEKRPDVCNVCGAIGSFENCQIER